MSMCIAIIVITMLLFCFLPLGQGGRCQCRLEGVLGNPFIRNFDNGRLDGPEVPCRYRLLHVVVTNPDPQAV